VSSPGPHPTARLQYRALGIQAGVDFASSDLATVLADGLVRYVRTTDITGLRSLRPDGVYAPADLVPENALARNGDLLLTRAGSLGTAYLHSGDPVAVAGYLVRCQLDDTCDARFYAYYCQSRPFLDALRVGATQTTIQNFSASKYASLSVPVPPLEVQRRVADQLDIETARVDTLIAKNEQVLGLLRTRWQSLLEATIFVDTATDRAPLWLVCEITPGYAFPSAEFLPEGPVRLLRGINVGVGALSWDETVYGAWSTVEPAEEYRLVAGDLVLGMDRPWISTGLRVAKVSSADEPAYLVQRVARLRPRAGLDRDYLFQVLQSRRFYSAFEPAMTGVSVPHVSGGQIGDFRVPLPALEEQQRIVSRLAEAARRAQELRHRVQRQQALLGTRRQALITAAVTGQIDV
jgi:type I restriction enzyme, S subunit